MFDLWTVLVFHVLDRIVVKLRIEVAPFIICVTQRPSAGFSFAKSLQSLEDVTIFFTRSWIALILWLLVAASGFGTAGT